MPWLLDTNICIELLRGRNDRLRQRLVAHDIADIALCSVVRAKLYVGAQLAADPAEALRRLARFDVLTSYPSDEPAALAYGRTCAHLRRQGQLIGVNDLIRRHRTCSWSYPGNPQHPRIRPRTRPGYRRLGNLMSDPNNPWGIRFMAIFHMANDSHLFRTAPGEGPLPLYEAKMIRQFDHRFVTYEGFLSPPTGPMPARVPAPRP
jgi:tRNA(fMet)-specific endonuclease VapC